MDDDLPELPDDGKYTIMYHAILTNMASITLCFLRVLLFNDFPDMDIYVIYYILYPRHYIGIFFLACNVLFKFYCIFHFAI